MNKIRLFTLLISFMLVVSGIYPLKANANIYDPSDSSGIDGNIIVDAPFSLNPTFPTFPTSGNWTKFSHIKDLLTIESSDSSSLFIVYDNLTNPVYPGSASIHVPYAGNGILFTFNSDNDYSIYMDSSNTTIPSGQSYYLIKYFQDDSMKAYDNTGAFAFDIPCPTPEPTSMILSVFGVLGTVFLRKRI